MSSLILPPRAVFYDALGNPLSGGLVNTYVPGGTTAKLTWQDSTQFTPNSNPIILDSAGSCLLYGNGSYQITVTDAIGNAIPGYSGLTADATTETGVSPALLPFVGAASLAAAGALLGIDPLPSIAALRALTNASNILGTMNVQGYVFPGDGGGGAFTQTPIDTTSPDNGGTIIIDAANRRWYRVTGGVTSVNLLWFCGAGVADFSPGLSLALGAATSEPQPGVEIYVPAGNYTFNSPVVFTYPATPCSVTIRGGGAGVSIMTWVSTDGLIFSGSTAFHGVHIRDLTMRCGSTNTANAIALLQSNPGGLIVQSDIKDVTFDGTSAGTNVWNIGVKVVGWGNVIYDSDLFYTNLGVSLVGVPASSFKFCIVHNFLNCFFFGTLTGIQYGDWTQGVTVNQCNFTNGTTGILVPSLATNQLSQLTVTDSQFGVTGTSISVMGNINEVMINDNLIIQALGTAAITFSGTSLFNTISNNVFPAAGVTGTIGIAVSGPSGYTNVTGNIFASIGQAIVLAAPAIGWNVQSNSYPNCTTQVNNGGTGNTIGGGSA